MRLTKIIATIGPASESEETLIQLIKAGVDIFRLNFKHNTPEWHQKIIRRIKLAQKKAEKEVSILLDLQGEEIRLNLPQDYYQIKEGDVLFYSLNSEKEDGKKYFYFSHPEVIKFLKKGEVVLVDDARFRFIVDFIDSTPVLISQTTGVLYDRKTASLPESEFTFGRILERDLKGIDIAVKEKVDFLAVSFVKYKEDLQRIKDELKNFDGQCLVISKLETRQAIQNLDELIRESYGVMVARGDLAVETSMEEMPYLQKKIIKKSILAAKPVITATQMLESMTENFFPTRAEISDVANAVYDLTDAVMLSNETAIGKYPIRTVEVMSKILSFNEKKDKGDIRLKFSFNLHDQEEIIVDSAYGLSLRFKRRGDKIRAFVVFTHTGRTAKLLSRYRPVLPVYAFSPFQKVVKSLNLSYGVIPFYYLPLKEKRAIEEKDILNVLGELKKRRLVKNKDKVIVLHGDVLAIEGGTSTIHIVEI